MSRIISIILISIIAFNISNAQSEKNIEGIALKMINQASYCSLATIDNNGFPAARMMQTLPVEDDFIIWLGTKNITQKVEQINTNPKVSVYFEDTENSGYVNIQGLAEIVTDKENKAKHWKNGWEQYYPDKENDFVLIKITPIRLQIVSYAKGIVSTDENWKATEIKYKND